MAERCPGPPQVIIKALDLGVKIISLGDATYFRGFVALKPLELALLA